MMKLWTVIAAAAMGLVACQNNFEEFATDAPANSVVVKFIAEESRTSVETSGEVPMFSWDENETFAVLEQTDALAEATSVTYSKVDGKANIDAEFVANAGQVEYKYAAVYPKAGYVAAENINAVTLALPATQIMAEGSYDPNADLMVSMVVTANAQPTEVVPMRFTRLAAVAKLTLKNLSLGDGEVIEKVVFMADGKNLAGKITANLAEDPHAFEVSKGVSSVEVATSSTGDVYFTVLPTTLEAGDEYGVVVLTNKALYAKKGTIPAEKSLIFEAGQVTRIGVNMSGITASDKWVLVRDAATLKQGDIVAIAVKDYAAKALSTKLYGDSTTETATNAKRAAVDIYKLGDYMLGGSDVQKLILVTGVADGTFSFYDEARKKFLVSNTKSNAYLISQSYYDLNTSFAISVDAETTVATITNTEGDYKGNFLKYNTGGYFVSNTSSYAKDVCIYKLDGAEGTIPVVAANITVPASDKPVVIAEEGATVATAIEEVVFNYVGDWTISVSDNADWLTVAYDATNKKVTYTAEPNTDPVREAEVTITATLEGQEDITWPAFKVLQKGAPMEISIAEFITKEKNVNVTYKLTGVLTSIPSSYSYAYVIEDEDGNKANIKYLKNEANNKWVVNDDDIDLKVGDVITVTTVVTTAKANGGNTTYPSYYKGYYRLTTSVDTPLVSYEGGTATITVAAEGNLLPTDGVIKGAMAEAYDFVAFSHTDNAATATATFAENNGSSREAEFNFTYGWTSASVKVAQSNHPSVKVGWFLVTNVSELAVGDTVIVVAKDSAKALAVGSSTTSATTMPSVDVTKTGTAITDLPNTVTQFTIGAGLKDGEFAFNFLKGTTAYYLCAPNTSAHLKIKDGDLLYYGSWTISIDATTGEATIDTIYGTTTPTPKRMRYNGTSTKFITNKTDVEASTNNAAISLYKYYN